MIDYDVINNTFVQVARDAVGARLSSIGPVGSMFPAVIRQRSKGPKPKYHYVTFDILNAGQTKGWILQSGVTAVNEFSFWETDYTLLMQYTVYGDEAKSIANELEGYFRLNRVRDNIRIATGGAIVETFEVVSTPERLATEFVEAAFFNLTFSIVDRVVDSQTGVFDTVILNGELFRNQKDLNPLPIDITATSVAS